MTFKKLNDYIDRMEDPSSAFADNPFDNRSMPFRADSYLDLMQYNAASTDPKTNETARAFVSDVVSYCTKNY
jgi:hypothetical protein